MKWLESKNVGFEHLHFLLLGINIIEGQKKNFYLCTRLDVGYWPKHYQRVYLGMVLKFLSLYALVCRNSLTNK